MVLNDGEIVALRQIHEIAVGGGNADREDCDGRQ